MACSNSSCQSGCYNHEDDGETPTPTPSPSPSPSPTNAAANGSTCIKCKANAAGEDGRFCAECFRSSLFGKFRFAVTSNGMINPTDKVLVAFSGGTASRVALQFVHEMQEKAQKNFDASRDRSLPVFGVGVVFIDESLVRSVPSCEHDKVVEHIKSVVSSLAPPSKELHVIHIESIYGSDVAYGKSRLRDLLDSVSDVTGKEDLLLHQRMLCLQKIAVENGYNKLILGSCTSRLACHVLSATVKGQGYSLPADIQYVDSRWEIPVMLPLRDCLLQELNMLCQLDGAD